jgi:catechol 2,3-dioxygenase-like lactoylglutathione lyase family enzyme
MSFRIELFVNDVDASIRFYQRALGFRVVRREADYASLELGDAVLGLAPIMKLPACGEGPGFTRARLAGVRGAGVEIVLEVSDVDTAAEAAVEAGYRLVEPLRERPWGLRDFRVVDPDGYYLRITTPDAGRRASDC